LDKVVVVVDMIMVFFFMKVEVIMIM